MPQTIDVTGLTVEQVRKLEQEAEGYRARPDPPPPAGPVPAGTPRAFWTGPVPAPGARDWVDWFNAWCDSRPRREGPVEIDDDRGSIYDRDGAN